MPWMVGNRRLKALLEAEGGVDERVPASRLEAGSGTMKEVRNIALGVDMWRDWRILGSGGGVHEVRGLNLHLVIIK